MKPRTAGIALTVGALALAIVTWLELFFGPVVDTDPATALVTPGAVPIHIVSFLAFLALVLALPTLGRVLNRRSGVLASFGLAVGLWLGVVPHTVLDFSAIPMAFDELDRAQATALTDRMYEVIGPLAMIGLLLVVVSIITLAVAGWRTAALPRWAAWAGFAALPGAALLGVLGGLLPDVPVPHPPVALDLVLAAYGIALWRSAERAPAAAAVAAM